MTDIHAKTSLREILNDTLAPYTYTDFAIQTALSDNRETILYRNPFIQATGQFINRGYNARIRVPFSNDTYSLLQAEPGGFCFQALKFCRHWDSSAAPQIWVSGTLQDPSTYTIDYPSGRVTFGSTHNVGDWQPVNASFCYYKIYHAARMILLASLPTNPTKIGNGPDQLKFNTIKDQIAGLSALIGEMIPKNITISRKLY